jgi:hypothetical protein
LDVLGEIAEVSAVLATRLTSAVVADTGETLPVSAPYQGAGQRVLASGAPLSIHYRGGTAREDERGHQTTERMPQDTCQFFYDCRLWTTAQAEAR